MKTLIQFRSNPLHQYSKEKGIIPSVELILVTTENEYEMTIDHDLVKKPNVETSRFVLDFDQIDHLIEYLKKTKEHYSLEEKEEEQHKNS